MARDKYHNDVKIALEKEGWTITHDPFFIRLGKRKGYIDLGHVIIYNYSSISIEKWIKS